MLSAHLVRSTFRDLQSHEELTEKGVSNRHTSDLPYVSHLNFYCLEFIVVSMLNPN